MQTHPPSCGCQIQHPLTGGSTCKQGWSWNEGVLEVKGTCDRCTYKQAAHSYVHSWLHRASYLDSGTTTEGTLAMTSPKAAAMALWPAPAPAPSPPAGPLLPGPPAPALRPRPALTAAALLVSLAGADDEARRPPVPGPLVTPRTPPAATAPVTAPPGLATFAGLAVFAAAALLLFGCRALGPVLGAWLEPSGLRCMFKSTASMADRPPTCCPAPDPCPGFAWPVAGAVPGLAPACLLPAWPAALPAWLLPAPCDA